MTTLPQLLHSSSLAFTLTGGVLGLVVGSFLNVVIHRLPKMMERSWRQQCAELLQSEATNGQVPASGKDDPGSDAPYNLIVPRSACPKCNHRIRAVENIPVISYLLLGGKCANCKERISIRYPLIEAVSGILSGYIAWHFGFGIAAAAAILFAWSLIALTVIDIDTQLLPDSITLPLLWAGLLANCWGIFTPLDSAVIGAIAGYLSLWSVYWLFKLATGKEGMGFGDFKLLAAIGAWLGWKMLPLVILLSSFVGAIVGILLIVLRRHGRNVPIPFGPYLAAAGLIAILWGSDLNDIYLGLFR